MASSRPSRTFRLPARAVGGAAAASTLTQPVVSGPQVATNLHHLRPLRDYIGPRRLVPISPRTGTGNCFFGCVSHALNFQTPHQPPSTTHQTIRAEISSICRRNPDVRRVINVLGPGTTDPRFPPASRPRNVYTHLPGGSVVTYSTTMAHVGEYADEPVYLAGSIFLASLNPAFSLSILWLDAEGRLCLLDYSNAGAANASSIHTQSTWPAPSATTVSLFLNEATFYLLAHEATVAEVFATAAPAAPLIPVAPVAAAFHPSQAISRTPVVHRRRHRPNASSPQVAGAAGSESEQSHSSESASAASLPSPSPSSPASQSSSQSSSLAAGAGGLVGPLGPDAFRASRAIPRTPAPTVGPTRLPLDAAAYPDLPVPASRSAGATAANAATSPPSPQRAYAAAAASGPAPLPHLRSLPHVNMFAPPAVSNAPVGPRQRLEPRPPGHSRPSRGGLQQGGQRRAAESPPIPTHRAPARPPPGLAPATPPRTPSWATVTPQRPPMSGAASLAAAPPLSSPLVPPPRTPPHGATGDRALAPGAALHLATPSSSGAPPTPVVGQGPVFAVARHTAPPPSPLAPQSPQGAAHHAPISSHASRVEVGLLPTPPSGSHRPPLSATEASPVPQHPGSASARPPAPSTPRAGAQPSPIPPPSATRPVIGPSPRHSAEAWGREAAAACTHDLVSTAGWTMVPTRGVFPCQVNGCGLAFASKGDLAAHVRLSHDHLCVDCLRSFNLNRCGTCDHIIAHNRHNCPGRGGRHRVDRQPQPLPSIVPPALQPDAAPPLHHPPPPASTAHPPPPTAHQTQPQGLLPTPHGTPVIPTRLPRARSGAQQVALDTANHIDLAAHAPELNVIMGGNVAPDEDAVWANLRRLVAGMPLETIFAPGPATTPFLPRSQSYRRGLSSVWAMAFRRLETAATDPDATDHVTDFTVFFALPKLLFGQCYNGQWPKRDLLETRLGRILLCNTSELDTVPALRPQPARAATAARTAPHHHPPPTGDLDARERARRAETHTAAGNLALGWRGLSSTTRIAPVNEATVRVLQEQHPAPTVDTPLNAPPTTRVPVGTAPVGSPSLAGVRQGFHKFSRCSAPGPSGLRVEHMLCMIPTQGFYSSLHMVVSRLTVGAVPATMRPFLFGALLTPITKPDGGVRPIAVGEVLVRVGAKALAGDHAGAFSAFLTARAQVGVACAAGADATIHSVRLALASHRDWVALKLDFRNAFNTMPRSLILSQLREHFPDLLPYFFTRYGLATNLTLAARGDFNATTILSQEGVQQGDPLGPFFFSLGLSAITSHAFAATGQPPPTAPDPTGTSPTAAPSAPAIAAADHLRMFYLDDNYLVGTPEAVSDDYTRLVYSAGILAPGLLLNATKSYLFSPTVPMEDVLDQVRAVHGSTDFDRFRHVTEGLVVLGTPIGTQEFIATALEDGLADFRLGLERLRQLDSIQIRLLLLRLCGPQRLNHIIRTTPPSACAATLDTMDELILQALVECQGFGSAHPTWEALVRLPLRLGGSGLPSALALSPLAYAASVADAARLRSSPVFAAVAPAFEQWLSLPGDSPEPWAGAREIHTCLAAFHTRLTAHIVNQPNNTTTPSDNRAVLPRLAADLLGAEPKLQQRLSRFAHEMSFWATHASSSNEIRARMLSQKQPGSSLLLQAIPSCPALRVTNDVMSCFLYTYQGLNELSEVEVWCSCRNDNAPPVRHRLTHNELCNLGEGYTIRHNRVVYAVAEMLRGAGFDVRLQHYHRGAIQSPDLVVANFPTRGLTSYVEVSIISPFRAGDVNRAAYNILFSANLREKEKIRKYIDHAQSRQFCLYPYVLESPCAFGRVAQAVNTIANRARLHATFAESAGGRTWSSSTFKKYWGQVLAVEYWTGVQLSALEVSACRALRAGTGTVQSPISQGPRWQSSPEHPPSQHGGSQGGEARAGPVLQGGGVPVDSPQTPAAVQVISPAASDQSAAAPPSSPLSSPLSS